MRLNRRLTFSEELGNTITHGVMAAATLILLPIGSLWGYFHGGYAAATGISIFIMSLLLMFLSSTLYHAMYHNSKHKAVFRILDHIFIYVAIAGSYTPVALVIIGGWKGILIVVIQWIIVLVGILYKSLATKAMPKLSLTLYLVMGWIAIFFFPTLLRRANTVFLVLVVLGGVMYSIGAYFFAHDYKKYYHMIWHLFINVAAILHLIGIGFFLYRK